MSITGRSKYIDISELNEEINISIKEDKLTENAYEIFVKMINLILPTYKSYRDKHYAPCLYFLMNNWKDAFLSITDEAKKEEISYYEVLRIIIIKGLDINYVKAYAINKRFKK